jgi:CD109 antigen
LTIISPDPTQYLMVARIVNPPPYRPERFIYKEPAKIVMNKKKFPETFFFDLADLSKGEVNLTKLLPATVTSWVITAFAIDPDTGLAFMEAPKKLKVLQPFFVSMNLPYSMKLGEILTIPVTVFNNSEKDQRVKVILLNKDDEFKVFGSEKSEIEVKANDESTANFKVKVTKVGNVKIKVAIESENVIDGVEQVIVVKPEGATQYKTKAMYVDLRREKEFKTNFGIEIPENSVQDSIQLEVNVVGDILGPPNHKLDQLM